MTREEMLDRVDELGYILDGMEYLGDVQSETYYKLAAEWNSLRKELKGEA